MKRAKRLVVAALLGFTLSGCAAVIENHGYAPDDEAVATISVGQDTRNSVAQKIGRPSVTGVFTEDGWYYVATTVEKYLYNAPKVIDRRVVAVRFGEDDRVAAVNIYGVKDGRIIDLERQTTPTYGRQLTILQQIFGNLGRFESEEVIGQ